MSAPPPPALSGMARLVTVAILVILTGTLFLETAAQINARLVSLGDAVWEGYALNLRRDPDPPLCDLDESRIQKQNCVPEATPTPSSPPPTTPDDGSVTDPFADPPADASGSDEVADPFGGDDDGGDVADPFGGGDDGGDVADPFGGDDDGGDPFGGDDGGDDVADPFGGDGGSGDVADPFGDGGGGGGDEVTDPFGDGGGGGEEPEGSSLPVLTCPQAEAALSYCEAEYQQFEMRTTSITSSVRAFRSFELFFSRVAGFPFRKELLSIVLLLGGLMVTVRRAHIALRKPQGRLEFTVGQLSQLASHVMLALSAWAQWRVQAQLTVESSNPALPIIWMVGFGLVGLVNVYHLARPPKDLPAGGTALRALLCVPLYAFMTLGSGAYFLLAESYLSGQAVYLYKFMQYPTIYLAVALYVWAGMMLERSEASPRLFNVLRPWKMTPMLLGWLVVVMAAVPTAYSGASGIFVIAAGAIVFEELRRAGASKQQAVMFTAMSGSLGVVLQPCLVVVLIAALNKEVTTDQLFDKGLLVFLLTAAVFLVAVLALNREPLRLRSPAEAMPETLAAARGLVPYVLIGGGVLAAYYFILDTPLNEQTAPQLLPVVLLAVLIFEARARRHRASAEAAEAEGEEERTLGSDLVRATGESSEHIGALLFLMCASVCLGGVVERAELMDMVPESFGSTFVTMGVLVVIMVLVGMTMDAMGAVILVSITVANVAYRNGIDPVHFWMMVLVAFELGYLTPPVSLNHLLARQVIGREAHLEDDEHASAWSRYEHIIVPMIVMGVSLLIVAFVPLLWY